MDIRPRAQKTVRGGRQLDGSVLPLLMSIGKDRFDGDSPVEVLSLVWVRCVREMGMVFLLNPRGEELSTL